MTTRFHAIHPGPTRFPSFRHPVHPHPIEPYEIAHPDVPVELDGLTILHITDLHITRPGIARAGAQRILRAVAAEQVDLILLTGDYMTRPGQESAALAMLERLAGSWRTRLGAFGIFGNHDSPDLARRAARIHGITWLNNQPADIDDLPLTILGVSYPEDVLATVLASNHGRSSAERLRILLAHYPTEVFPAASAGIPMVLAGHTHGGQLRPTSKLVPHTSCDLPPNLASGILQLDRTLCIISRGVGEAILNFRINCPPQIPLLTLRRGELAREPSPRLEQVRAW